MAIYEYNLTTDFPDGIDVECLDMQVRAFDFPTPLEGVTVIYNSDRVNIEFTGALSPADQDQLDIIVNTHNPVNCPVTIAGLAAGGYGDAEALALTSTTSTNPIQKLSLQCDECPSGRYRIGWFYQFACSSQSDDFRARVQVDNTTELMYHSQELKDAGTDQSNLSCGFAYINLDEGNHFIDLDYWSENGDTSYISNARLEIWRVA